MIPSWLERDEVIADAIGSRTGQSDLVAWGLEQKPVVQWPSCLVSLWGIAHYILAVSPDSSPLESNEHSMYLRLNCFTVLSELEIVGPKGRVPIPHGLLINR